MLDNALVADQLTTTADRVRAGDDVANAHGHVLFECFGPDGKLKWSQESENLITSAGDAMYVARGAGLTSIAAPTGMRLGTSSTAVTKSGAGAALGAYLAGSNKAFDATFPSVAANVVTYRRTYAAGEATSASNITEAVIVNDTIGTDATSPVANTAHRVLLQTPAPKGALDSLVVTWTATITGS